MLRFDCSSFFCCAVLAAVSLITGPTWADPVTLKTGQTTLTRSRQFELRDGVVYGGPISALRSELKPVESLAGPFTTPPKFKSIQADSSILVAEAEDGRLFMLEYPTPGTLAADVIQQWSDQWGMPYRSTLKLPRGAKAWSFSNRNLDVAQYEDAQGQEFHWGIAGCSTLYALSGDGRRLHYTDPWLPADFSREVCLPEHGTFIAENFSSSASTLFVIGRNGEMFTRIDDYDLNGGTPFYDYRYDPVQPHGIPGTDPKSEYQTRRPFPADWQVQPLIPLQGQAQISRLITILQNGRGNAARELRVAGRNAVGKLGYYYKNLNEGLAAQPSQAWKFQSADVEIQPADWLTIDVSEASKRLNRGPDQSFSLKGTRFKTQGSTRQDLELQALRFNWACGPAEIKFQTKSGQNLTARLHLADGWVPFVQEDRYQANQALADSAAEQIPFIRNYKGTLDLPVELQDDRDLGDLQFKSFAVAVTVGPGWAKVWNDQLELSFGVEPYLPLFSARLEQESVWTADLTEPQAILAGVKQNLALYQAFAQKRADLHQQKSVSGLIQAGFEVFDKGGLITWAGPGLLKQPYWNTVQHGRTLMRLGQEWTSNMEALTRANYSMARSILRERICTDLERLKGLKVNLANGSEHLDTLNELCQPPSF